MAPRGWYNIGGNTDSAMGFDVLRQFVVRFDYPRQRLWLKRTGDARVTYLGVDYALTVSCYQATAEGEACGLCDSCRLRQQGFSDAGVPDPTRYR